MNFRMISLAGLSLALAGCTTSATPGGPGLTSSALESRWVGQSAGIFFANYGPPIGDTDDGGMTQYTWRGGYKTIRVPARSAQAAVGKKGKRLVGAQTRYLSCTVTLGVDSSYTIRRISTVSDRVGTRGPSYCAEFLAGDAGAQ